jgi:putative sigma-54 modulation protein
MKVNVVGRHVKVTDAMQQYAEEKAGKLDRFFKGIRHVDIVMDVNGLANEVETAVVLGHGLKFVGKAEAEDMYAAIDAAESKIEKQIRRFNSKLKNHRDRSRIGTERAVAPGDNQEDEATYEAIVREMLEEET